MKHRGSCIDTALLAVREFGSLIEMGATAGLSLVPLSVLGGRFTHQYLRPSRNVCFDFTHWPKIANLLHSHITAAVRAQVSFESISKRWRPGLEGLMAVLCNGKSLQGGRRRDQTMRNLQLLPATALAHREHNPHHTLFPLCFSPWAEVEVMFPV